MKFLFITSGDEAYLFHLQEDRFDATFGSNLGNFSFNGGVPEVDER